MKEIKAILTGLIIFGLVYLLGAFTQNNFNIQYWSENARFFTAVLGGIFGIITITTKYIDE